MEIPIPSDVEQQRIAEFLDRKCGEIDEAIALQEEFIEELKAYKQSVITECHPPAHHPTTNLNANKNHHLRCVRAILSDQFF